MSQNDNTTSLIWQPDSSDIAPDTFVDAKRGREFTPGTHDVDSDAAPNYLAHPCGGWTHPDNDMSGVPAVLIRKPWNTVKKAVTDGRMDDHLTKLEELEQRREQGSRKSVLGAIQRRRRALEGDSTSDDSNGVASNTDDSMTSDSNTADDFEAALDDTFSESIRGELEALEHDPDDTDAEAEG